MLAAPQAQLAMICLAARQSASCMAKRQRMLALPLCKLRKASASGRSVGQSPTKQGESLCISKAASKPFLCSCCTALLRMLGLV